MARCKFREKHCVKQAYYGKEYKKPLFCRDHSDETMENVVADRCKLCKTLPSFNYDGERAEYCKEHKLPKMVDVKSKKCKKCRKQPTFGRENGKAEYCKDHKEEGMVNVTNKKCEDCKKTQACFGYEGGHPTHCFTHKNPMMVNVKSKRCKECKSRASHGVKTPEYCAKHKKKGMANITGPKCLYCSITPTYGFKGKRPLCCSKHRKRGMIPVLRKCGKCKTVASFGYKRGLALFCNKHKISDMVNVINKLCLTESCGVFVKNKYKGYCFRCFINMFPDEEIVKNYRTKEKTVVDFIREKYPFLLKYISFNKCISGGISLRRPDIFIKLKHYCIIIEIDEYEHSSYEEICENRRIMELSKDVNHKPIVLIRFNPDSYTDENDTRISSCWTTSKKRGLAKIDKGKITEWESRLNFLRKRINYWLKNFPEKIITEELLFCTCKTKTSYCEEENIKI